MNLRTKKIIAREFLIAIGVLLLSGLCFLGTFPYNNIIKRNIVSDSTKIEVQKKQLQPDDISQNLSQLYDFAKPLIGLDMSEKDFETKMSDPDNALQLYKALSAKANIPDWDSFQEAIGLKKKDNGSSPSSVSPSQLPSQSETTATPGNLVAANPVPGTFQQKTANEAIKPHLLTSGQQQGIASIQYKKYDSLKTSNDSLTRDITKLNTREFDNVSRGLFFRNCLFYIFLVVFPLRFLILAIFRAIKISRTPYRAEGIVDNMEKTSNETNVENSETDNESWFISILKRRIWLAFGAGIVLILMLTNPSMKQFKEYLGMQETYGLRRTSNWLIFSTYSSHSEVDYIGVFNNFIVL